MYQYLPGIHAKRKISFRVPKFLPVFRIMVLLVILLITGLKVQAQDFFPTQADFGIRLGADYELPAKSLKDDYKGALNYNGGFLMFRNQFTFGLNLSYRQFEAKYPLQSNNNPTKPISTSISPYHTFLFYVSGAYNLQVAPHVKVYGGLNLGGGISGYGYHQTTDYGTISHFEEDFSESEKQGYVAPKLGANFYLDDNWDLDLHAAYNIYTTGGDYTYNSRTGGIGQSISVSTSISAGLGFVFKF